jgi:MoaA/NifB/PqqE/SkfB family radical SAM enzyme
VGSNPTLSAIGLKIKMKETSNNSLCSYPWRSATVRPNGQVVPCCRYSHNFDINNESNIEKKDPRNSTAWNNLRNKMLLAQPINECIRCYNDEQSGIKSLRQESLEYYTPINNNPETLFHLELAFNNLCNLACAGCSSYFSSKWYNEDYKKGKIKKIGVIENNFSFDLWDLKDLRYLKIIGGEPLMSQDKFIKLLSLTNLDNLSILIITNGTMFPKQELKDLLLKSKHLSINLSLDGIGTVNDWFRWPSDFDQIVKNMELYNNWSLSYPNVSLKIHCVISAINVMYLEEITDFMRNNFPNWGINWDWLVSPSQLSVSIFPDNIKNSLSNDLIKLNSDYYKKEKNEILRPNPYKITIDRLDDFNNKNWNDFREYVTELSNDRNLIFLEMLTKFMPLMK